MVIGECHRQALRLLHRNLSPHGFLAASPSARAHRMSYDAVFARDAALCVIAAARSGDEDLVEGARRSLVTLADHQADNGQIPKFVLAGDAQADFWYVGCIDATLWWLIALHDLDRQHPGLGIGAALATRRERALAWLACQEHPRLRLLVQNEASDWADIMPRSGFVLYSNALWYYVKRLYDLPARSETLFHFNHLFFPFHGELPDYRRLRLLGHYVRNRARRRDLYLSFVNFSFWGEEGDVYGNLLAVLLGLASESRAREILRALQSLQVDQPRPVRATCFPIAPDDPLWRSYMGRHRQNLPFQYHNAGCWPFIGGFWVMALAAMGARTQAQAALQRLAETNALHDWEFNEWFHGETGEPRGMPGQSWSAAAFLLAERSLVELPFGRLHDRRPRPRPGGWSG